MHRPYTALIVHLSNDAAERNSATTTRIACQVLGVVLSVAISGAVINWIDPSDAQDAGSCRICDDPVPVADEAAELAHFVPSAIIALLAALFGIVCVAFTWEQNGVELARAQDAVGAGPAKTTTTPTTTTPAAADGSVSAADAAAADNNTAGGAAGGGTYGGVSGDGGAAQYDTDESFMDGVKLVFKSRNFKIILVAQMLAWMANTVNSANLKLYFKYVYCREEVFDLSTTLLLASLMLSIPLWYVTNSPRPLCCLIN